MARKAKQYANRVKILKYVKVERTWRFANVVERNGRIIRDHVLIQGKDETHIEGTYYIEWYELDNQRRRKALSNLLEAVEEARRKYAELDAIRAGVIEANTHSEKSSPRSAGPQVVKVIDEYLDLVKHQRSLRTYRTYRYTLDTLLKQSCTTSLVADVSRDDILKFMTDCYKLGLCGRTVYDKLVVVLQMFKRYGRTKLIEANDWPDYVEKIRPIYEPEEILGMFAAADPDELLFLKFMLASGFRDREEQHATWRDLDSHNSCVRVTAKPRWGFKPKNWEERVVPLPTALIEQLQMARDNRHASSADLLFPNSKGNPDTENDMIVKRVAERAKLNCGQCVTRHGNRCSEGPHCQHFFLHKFRHTFATEHLRHGIDIRTLQSWMGHRDIKSTMVYLKGVHSRDAMMKVNAGSLAGYMSMEARP